MSAVTTAVARPGPLHPVFEAGTGLSEAARAVLGRHLYAVLGTENPDGSAHLTPLMFLFDGRRILLETGEATRKARNVAARPRASVLVDTPEASWVSGHGPARVVRGAEALALNRRIRSKYLTAEGEAACGELLGEIDDVTIVVTPSRWRTWGMTAFWETLAARGVDLGGAERWFRSDEGGGGHG